MARTPRVYRRLSRSLGSYGFSHSVWEGPDHLLLVESSRFSESYRRLYYRDLRGFYFFPSRRRIWLGMAALLPIGLGLLFQVYEAPPAVLGSFTGLSVLLLVINLLLGPTVTARVHTGAHLLELPSILRLRRARKITERIAAKVAAAQADLAVGPRAA